MGVCVVHRAESFVFKEQCSGCFIPKYRVYNTDIETQISPLSRGIYPSIHW
ncbi:hypothetical protein APHMUC_0340 [Anaplasma phagocytophilum str. ApMUC09]|uniref:Uncharacterized protein n=1 Tax=Anaplasma phagocytophilum str. ApMUC09 TaxID=1359152 RepID=A0A0F3NAJ9_ANAPH|nr:hypothetical protein APHMUC_0340 [Anaplasma phagocytophilum str. ApMUC09]